MKLLTLIVVLFLSSETVPAVQPKPKERAPIVLPADGIDPICRMTVKKGETRTSQHKGHIIGFCSDYCKKKFDENPDKYLKK